MGIRIAKCILTFLGIVALLGACSRGSKPQLSAQPPNLGAAEDADFSDAPVDRGSSATALSMTALNGTKPDAHVKGVWSEAVEWPLIAIHSVLLPDGKVMTYGHDGTRHGFTYDIWDPEAGLTEAAHQTLDVTTGTNIFCSAQAFIPGVDQMLIAGGSVGDNGGSTDINIFDADSYAITKSPAQMLKGRWYPTFTTLPNGELLLHGGREVKEVAVTMPEVYNHVTGWRDLPGADSAEAYNGSATYYYPWSFVTPSGKVFFTANQTAMWLMDTADEGSLVSLGDRPDGLARWSGSAVLYGEGKIMVAGGASLDVSTDTTLLIDVNQDVPEVSRGPSMAYSRSELDLTVLPTGEILATGGSAEKNRSVGVAYAAEIWSPESGEWRTLAEAAKPRLYHSTALLLPDASVLTAGGGAPGPVNNLNAEIYYPPYLFKKDGSGQFAARPSVKTSGRPQYNRRFQVELEGSPRISRVALIRAGSVTHAWDMEQRFVDLEFSQSGGKLSVSAPRRPELAPPGNYMLFVVDENGVPSEAAMVNLPVGDEAAQFGTVTAGQDSASAWTSVKFERGFSAPPVVAVSPPSYNGGHAATVRVRNVSATGFEYQLDEWEVHSGWHRTETLFYMALPEGKHDLGGLTAYAGRAKLDHRWTTLPLSGFRDTPAVFAQVASYNDAAAVTPRLTGVGESGFRARLQEQEAADGVHAEETLHYIALEYGPGSASGRPFKVGVFRTDHVWRRATFGGTFGAPYLLANMQSHLGGDTAALRYRKLDSGGVDLKVEEETSRDEETNHLSEDIAWLVLESD